MQIKMVVVIGKLLRRAQGCAAEYKLTNQLFFATIFNCVYFRCIIFELL